MSVLPREKDMRQFFSEGGFSGNPEMYAFNHYRSLLGNTEWVSKRTFSYNPYSPRLDPLTITWDSLSN